ncbi:MAG: integrase [Elusimicrobia bacterium]|nr:integrase [Elusimicrobiota bacterium]
MGPSLKKTLFEKIAKRYQEARGGQKSTILDEFCANFDFNRKYVIRRLNTIIKRKRPPQTKQKPGPKSKYDLPEVLKPLKEIWLASNLPCSKRLKAILPLWINSYQQRFGSLSFDVLKKLTRMSKNTIDRILKPIRILHTGKGRSTTKPGLILKHQIPIKTNQWDETRPGFLEADTVAHCGNSLAGDYAYTIDAVDIATGWTEQRAIFNKGEQGVITQMRDIEASLPFPLLGFDCDNGSEFLNWTLMKYFQNRKFPVTFTRSRPYHSDDNAHIEQKNWTHVRQWLGYRRFEDPRITDLLNDLYQNQWRLLHNFFLPSVKLAEKKRVGSQIVKKYDLPKTPCQRVLDSKLVSDEIKSILKKQFESLNPFQLKDVIDEKIKHIHKLAK